MCERLLASPSVSRDLLEKFLIGASKNDQQESSGRASQEVAGGANILAIPSISSHVLLPQAADQHAVPVFRISHGSHEIEPSAIPESSIAQGRRDCNSHLLLALYSSLRSASRSANAFQPLHSHFFGETQTHVNSQTRARRGTVNATLSAVLLHRKRYSTLAIKQRR